MATQTPQAIVEASSLAKLVENYAIQSTHCRYIKPDENLFFKAVGIKLLHIYVARKQLPSFISLFDEVRKFLILHNNLHWIKYLQPDYFHLLQILKSTSDQNQLSIDLNSEEFMINMMRLCLAARVQKAGDRRRAADITTEAKVNQTTIVELAMHFNTKIYLYQKNKVKIIQSEQSSLDFVVLLGVIEDDFFLLLNPKSSTSKVKIVNENSINAINQDNQDATSTCTFMPKVSDEQRLNNSLKRCYDSSLKKKKQNLFNVSTKREQRIKQIKEELERNAFYHSPTKDKSSSLISSFVKKVVPQQKSSGQHGDQSNKKNNVQIKESKSIINNQPWKSYIYERKNVSPPPKYKGTFTPSETQPFSSSHRKQQIFSPPTQEMIQSKLTFSNQHNYISKLPTQPITPYYLRLNTHSSPLPPSPTKPTIPKINPPVQYFCSQKHASPHSKLKSPSDKRENQLYNYKQTNHNLEKKYAALLNQKDKKKETVFRADQRLEKAMSKTQQSFYPRQVMTFWQHFQTNPETYVHQQRQRNKSYTPFNLNERPDKVKSKWQENKQRMPDNYRRTIRKQSIVNDSYYYQQDSCPYCHQPQQITTDRQKSPRLRWLTSSSRRPSSYKNTSAFARRSYYE